MILIQPPTVQNWNSLINKPSILSDNQISWDEIQNKPTTLAGYGITNGQPLGNELTALQDLSDSAGFLKKLGDGNYSIDNNNYLPLSGGNVTGNLGVGVGSPTVKLSIGRLGGAFTVPTLNANTTLLLTAGGGTTASGSFISVLGGNTSQVGIGFGDTDASEQGGVYYANPTDTLSFRAGNSVRISVNSTSTTFSSVTASTSPTTGAIRAASLGITGAIFAGNLYTTGNVGIGTASPSQQLDVNGSAKATSFFVENTQVISTRRTGWVAPTGTATRTTFATSTVTLSELAETVKALIDDLTTHGLIGA